MFDINTIGKPFTVHNLKLVFIQINSSALWIVCVFSSRQRSSSKYLMQTLWPQAPEVPHHVRVFHVGLGVTLLRVDEGWKLHSVQKPRVTCLICDLINYGTDRKIFTYHTHQESIPDEENGGVVASQVPVALFSVKLDRKASWISHGVCWPRFTSLKENTFVSWICCKYSIYFGLMHTSGATHPRWRSGQRWVLSSQRAQTLWPYNSEWCHESPQSSQTLLHYVRNNNIIVYFTCKKHSKSVWSSKLHFIQMFSSNCVQRLPPLSGQIFFLDLSQKTDCNTFFRHVGVGATWNCTHQWHIVITSAVCRTVICVWYNQITSKD